MRRRRHVSIDKLFDGPPDEADTRDPLLSAPGAPRGISRGQRMLSLHDRLDGTEKLEVMIPRKLKLLMKTYAYQRQATLRQFVTKALNHYMAKHAK